MGLYKWCAAAFIGATVVAVTAPIAAQTPYVPINRRGSPNPELRTLRPEIKAADPAQYKAVRDPKDWQNPYLTVGPNGVEVRARGLESRTGVPPAALAGVLANLPVSAWTYGRVVAVSGPSITNSPEDQKRATDANMKALLEVLKALDVEANSWPRRP